MRSFSEIEVTTKKASKAIGFSWGISEEVGKNIRLLEMFGLPGLKNLNQYYKIYKISNFENIDEIIKSFSHMIRLIPSNGTMIINKNDHNIKKLLQKGYWSKLKTVDSIKTSGDFNLIKKKQELVV